MKYKIVTSGTSKEVTLGEISRNFGISYEIYILSDKEIYLGMISHKTLVFFATEFADYALKNYAKKKSPEAEICISLVRKWIGDDTSVSNEELRAAANAAYAALAASNAAYVAANSANAANAAANAANAVYAAANAAGKDREKEFIRQGEFILDFLKSGKHLFYI
jgi:hypothetical protein